MRCAKARALESPRNLATSHRLMWRAGFRSPECVALRIQGGHGFLRVGDGARSGLRAVDLGSRRGTVVVEGKGMSTSNLPKNIRRRVKRAARKIRRTNKRTAKRELRCLAAHHPRFMPTGW
jgi:hypothetical protein